MNKHLHFYISIFFLVIISTFSYSQVNLEWAKMYNGSGNAYDEATGIAIDGSGNIYITGGSRGSGTNLDYSTIKYDPSGNVIWNSRYAGPGNGDDDAYHIILDNSGNVYVTGASTGEGTGYDYCVVKYNSSGVQQWAARYNGPANGNDEIYGIAVNSSTGDVYVTGYSTGTGTLSDICTVKYNSSGVQQWVVRLNGTANDDDYGNSMVMDALGNIYVTGGLTSADNDMDYVTIKYNPDGQQQWIKYYDGAGHGFDLASHNAIDANGNIYVAGYVKGISNSDYCTIKYNSSGVQQWAAIYNGTGNGVDEEYTVVVDNAGNCYVTGNSSGAGTGDDYCTIKYNSNGVQQWIARYNGEAANDDYANYLAVDNSGNVYVTGESWKDGSNFDIITLRYNSDGQQQWETRYNGTGNEYDNANFLALNGNSIYVTGGSDNNANTDFITIKYNQLIGIKNISSNVPDKFELKQNYPNPFNPATKIRFSVSPFEGGKGDVKLVIFNILGKEVQTLVNEQLAPGTYEVDWNASNFPSGVYYYRLTARQAGASTGDFSETKKMILVK
jgi:uncharacterized delta-60 repeat protein